MHAFALFESALGPPLSPMDRSQLVERGRRRPPAIASSSSRASPPSESTAVMAEHTASTLARLGLDVEWPAFSLFLRKSKEVYRGVYWEVFY